MSKDYKKMSMAKNCLFNGILITLHDKYDKKSGGGNIGGSC